MVERFLVFLIAFILISPSVSAISIFGTENIYSVSYDEEIFDAVKIGIVGTEPEITYWRAMQKQGEVGKIYFEVLFYWAEQEYYIAQHEHDWEFICIVMTDDYTPLIVAYDEWHYIIGRSTTFSLYNGSHIFVEIDVEYHAISLFDGTLNRTEINEGVNYTNKSVQHLDMSVLRDAQQQVGFNEELYEDPILMFERGLIFDYKVSTAWKSWWRSLLVRVDKSLKWVDFG